MQTHSKKSIIKPLLYGLVGFGVFAVVVAALVTLFIGARLNQEALKKEPEYTAAQLYSRAVEQRDGGDYASAEAYLEQALREESNDSFRSELAVVKYRLKKYPEAIDEYEKLIDAGRDAAFAWNGIGNAYRDWAEAAAPQRDEYQGLAESAYRKALTLNPQSVATYSNLALMLNSAGKKSAALAVLDEGIAVTKQDVLQAVRKNVAL